MKSVFIHPSAFVDEGAVVGAGTKVWHFCHVMGGARIGERCSLGQNVYIGAAAVIGNNVKIQNNVSVYDRVIIEDDVFCGPSMVFTNVRTPRAQVERKDSYEPTYIRRGASIGANATIVCGVTVGAYSLVGAGVVVTRNVPPHGLMMGVPARRVGWSCRCGELLRIENDEAVCRRCGDFYREKDGSLVFVEGKKEARQ